MHLLAFDLYYKYLYYQVVFARVNTWKVLRTSLHWSSWTELACFTGFTRFCPISLCVCMFIWVYICPCVYPTKKLAAWRARVICGEEKYPLPGFLKLLQTLVKLPCIAGKGLLCSYGCNLSLFCANYSKVESFTTSESHHPFLPRCVCCPGSVTAVTWESLAGLSDVHMIFCYLEIQFYFFLLYGVILVS